MSFNPPPMTASSPLFNGRNSTNYHFSTAEMPPHEASRSALLRRGVATVFLFLGAVCLSYWILNSAVNSVGMRLVYPSARVFPFDDSKPVSPETKLESLLKDASMKDGTVIMTTVNDAWAAPNSLLDLFLESFRYGYHTSQFLDHLVIIALDQKAYSRCLVVHARCYFLETKGADFSQQAHFMTSDYISMMWRRIDFLRSVLEMGFNFLFTDVDILWFRDPFQHFYSDADFQIACDHYVGNPTDLSNLPNGGFNFARSNNRTVEFYKYWYSSRERYPEENDQDVFNEIKHDHFLIDIGLQLRFLDTEYFGGFCSPARDAKKVCTTHANCCLGLSNKIRDLRLLLASWKKVMALPQRLKEAPTLSWDIPHNCSDTFFERLKNGTLRGMG